jgi:hypothetical protein
MKRIVVCDRGWVVVGEYAATDTEIVLTDASVIRRWGTSKGLGELRNGPTKETVLDPAGTIRVHPLNVVLTIDAEGWK